MAVFYPQIKLVHIYCVIFSGALFTVRGLLILGSSNLSNHAALRWLSYAIDTTLLTAALMLMSILHVYPFAQDWLTVKVLLLTVYIVLGVFALRRGRTRKRRAIYFTAAIAVFLYIVGVATYHHPLGVMYPALQR